MRIGWIELKRALLPVVVAVVSAAVTTVAVDSLRFLQSADRFVRDVELSWLAPRQPQSTDIVIVGIQESTLAQFKYRSPVDRRFLANLLRTLDSYKPRVIGLDVLFDQPTEPDKDEELKQVMRNLTTPLVVSYDDIPEDVTPQQKAFLDDFVPPDDRVLADIGTDPFDGTVRWMVAGKQIGDGSYMPGFARGVLERIGIESFPAKDQIAWRGRESDSVEPFREYPAQMVAKLPAKFFTGKIVLIGADVSLTDRHRTPFAALYEGNRGTLPGIVIHAHSVDQVLSNRRPPGIGAFGDFLLAITLAALGAALGITKIEIHWRTALGLVLAASWWAAGGAIYHFFGVMVGLVTPSLSLAIAMWGTEALTGREARQQREFIQGVFSRYVSPKVVNELMRDPAKLSLGGERRVVSLLFTDVASFTTMSEAIDSHQLVVILNQYFDGVCEVIRKHDGTFAKFIGDAVFAFFNAPTEQPDHAERAVLCALDIDRFAEKFRAEQNANGVPFGVTRIGIHTGPAMIGNFGAETNVDYTALGDSVNTAARLEGLNKFFGTHICVSQAAREASPGVPFRPLGLVVVKGKTTALGVYEPLTEERDRTDYIARYREAYRHLESGAQDADELFEALAVENPYDGAVQAHLDRLRAGTRSVEIAMTEK